MDNAESIKEYIARAKSLAFNVQYHDIEVTEQEISRCCCCCCCLHIKSRSDLYSVLSNIRTGPTDANAFRSHRLTTQKGYTYQKEIKDPEKSTHTQ